MSGELANGLVHIIPHQIPCGSPPPKKQKLLLDLLDCHNITSYSTAIFLISSSGLHLTLQYLPLFF